jgi:hypothetical protein
MFFITSEMHLGIESSFLGVSTKKKGPVGRIVMAVGRLLLRHGLMRQKRLKRFLWDGVLSTKQQLNN